MFAHTLDEQKKEPIRQFIYNMLYIWDDLSNINVNEDKSILDELIILTKECKNCINKKCPGGYNCKFGVCLRDNKICYNDLMYGKCYNMLNETNHNGNILCRCIHGIHLTEKKFIPYNQRMLSELTNIESGFLMKYNISFNSKNNIISIGLNDNTIKIAKDIISNKISKNEIINNLKIVNNIFSSNNNFIENTDDNIFDDIINEQIDSEENSEDLSNVNSDLNIINNIVIYDDKDNTIIEGYISKNNNNYQMPIDNLDILYKNQLEKISKYLENEETKNSIIMISTDNYEQVNTYISNNNNNNNN
jgi:hypothetical protein